MNLVQIIDHSKDTKRRLMWRQAPGKPSDLGWSRGFRERPLIDKGESEAWGSQGSYLPIVLSLRILSMCTHCTLWIESLLFLHTILHTI